MAKDNYNVGYFSSVPSTNGPAMAQTKYNPFVNLNPDSNLSMWNKFTDSLGFTNHSGQLAYQQQLASNQFESEYALRQQDLEYNSPSAQVQRLNDAGLNADLLGVGQYEGTASGNPQNNPEAVNGIQSALDRANGSFGSILNACFEGFKTYIAFKSGLIDVDRKQIENDILVDNAAELIGNRILRDTDMPKKGAEGEILPSYKPAFPNMKSKRLENAASAFVARNYGGLRHNINRYGESANANDARNLAVETGANPFTYGKSDDDATKTLADVNKLAIRVFNVENEFKEKLARYNIKDINSKEAMNLYEQNNRVQKIVNDFKEKTNELILGFLNNHVHDDTFLGNIMIYQMMAAQTGSTDMVSLGAKGLGAIGGIALNAGLRRTPVAAPVMSPYTGTTTTSWMP